MDLQVFHFFPKLPAELRLKIWYHTLPDPRELQPKLKSKNWPQPGAWTGWRLQQQYLRFGVPRLSRERTGGPRIADPIALRINRESRDLALTYYERRSGNVKPGEGYYIDFKIDSLHFDIMFFPRQIFPRLALVHLGIDSTDEMKRARAVTIFCIPFENYYPSVEVWMRDWHECFPNLEVIYLKFSSVLWSRAIIEPGRLRFDNEIESAGKVFVENGERYIEDLAREKETKGLAWKPPRVEAVWPENMERGPKYIYPSQYK